MSQQLGVLDKTFIAGEDLSSAQYYFVYISDDQTVSLCTTSHLDAIGVLQNDPKSGEEAVVRVIGTSKVKFGDAVAVGVRVISTTAGKADGIGSLSATEQIVLGITLEAAANNDIAEILLLPYGSYVKGTT
jgi:hypothetical protein